jgi:signal peptide peptidase SppA
MRMPTSLRNSLANLLPARLRAGSPIVPVVRLQGVIGFSTPLRPGLSLASVTRSLDRAFGIKKAKAVALIINSPGGSPSQSHLIFKRIRQLSEEKKLPVLAFVEDVAASGGYMIACAADEIICDTYSIAGSIGVVGGTFGFHKLIEKIGIERRLYTSGERKAMLDPFLPEKPEDVERIKSVQRDIHQHFIALVKSRRGGKLQGDDVNLFSGEYWTADKARGFGLIDSLGDLRSVLRERYGEKVKTPLMSEKRGLLSRMVPGMRSDLMRALTPSSFTPSSFTPSSFTTGSLTQGLADDLLSAAEARALWSRYGL